MKPTTTSVTNDEQEFHLWAFMGFLSFASKELVGQFEAETGARLSLPASPIERMIDAATGHNRALAEQFIDWAASQYGTLYLPADFKDQILKPAPILGAVGEP